MVGFGDRKSMPRGQGNGGLALNRPFPGVVKADDVKNILADINADGCKYLC